MYIGKNSKSHVSFQLTDVYLTLVHSNILHDLHDLHNDYPLAPERIKMRNVEKLIQNLNNKTNYVVHYEYLKLYESLGLQMTKIHRGIKFRRKWLAGRIH